jgi:hypothetical protein
LGFVDSFCAIGLSGTQVLFGAAPVLPDVEALGSVVVAPGPDVEDVEDVVFGEVFWCPFASVLAGLTGLVDVVCDFGP